MKYSEDYTVIISKIVLRNYINIYQDHKLICSSDIILDITNIPGEYVNSIVQSLIAEPLYYFLPLKINQENIIFDPPSQKKTKPWWKFW